MNIAKETILNLSTDDKLRVFNLIGNFPETDIFGIKMMINDPNMDPSISNSGNRNLHKFCMFNKILNKNIVNEPNPNLSFYQAEYCSLMQDINSFRYDIKIKTSLTKILRMPAYDMESMAAIENEIANLFLYVPESIKSELSVFLIDKLMGYKYAGYDFYQYLEMKDFFEVDASDTPMTHIYQAIKKIINSNGCKGYADSHDLAVFMYIYFSKLELVNSVKDKHMADRFIYYARQKTNNEKFVNDAIDILDSFILNHDNLSDVISYIAQSNKYMDIMNTIVDPYGYNIGDVKDEDSFEVNNMVFLTKDRDSFDNIDEDDVVKIRSIIPDVIAKYLDDEIPPEDIGFFITDNDYGHILYNDAFKICTTYDGTAKVIKYICMYEGQMFVLFKTNPNRGILYGISIDKMDNGDRLLLQMKKSGAYIYKYSSTM